MEKHMYSNGALIVYTGSIEGILEESQHWLGQGFSPLSGLLPYGDGFILTLANPGLGVYSCGEMTRRLK